MKIVRAREFKADTAWGAHEIASMSGITTRLHWTDQPYKWHATMARKSLPVLDGVVDIHVRQGVPEEVHELPDRTELCWG